MMASGDAADRLTLRTKLSSLALDDAQRDDANKQLAALDRKEADTLAAQRNQDAQTLAALQKQLRAGIDTDMNAQVASIRARSVARYRERADQLRTQFAPSNGPLIATSPNGAPQVNPNLPPALRARITQLHNDYTQAFQNDAKQTIADFQKTRADLTRRYALLSGTDVAAAQSAQVEIQALEKKRDDLYQQMVAQIDREVKTVAQERGVSTVVSSVAPAGGVDLTDDAMKDIETLHE
jgi:Skp family chaperone for outer membrane proteins